MFQNCQEFHVSDLLEISGFNPSTTIDKTKQMMREHAPPQLRISQEILFS
jgi:hypothetical protein